MESWNGDRINHSCLHWGHFNGEDWDKHRVCETSIPSLGRADGHQFDLVWDSPPKDRPQDGGCRTPEEGRLIWYIDGVPVMRAVKPRGTRRLEDFRIILNVAVGGNVCGGKMPRDGLYDFVVHELAMKDQPPGGWGRFEEDWGRCKEGHA